jgi:hypothetical protein
VLVYPRCSQDIDVTFETNGNVVRVLTVDLASYGFVSSTRYCRQAH